MALILYSCFLAYLLSGIAFIMFSPFLNAKKCIYFYQEFINYLHDNKHKTNLDASLVANDYLLVDYGTKFFNCFKFLCLFYQPILAIYNSFVRRCDIEYIENARKFIDTHYLENFKISNSEHGKNPLFCEFLHYGCTIHSIEKQFIEKIGTIIANQKKDFQDEVSQETQQERKDKS